MKIGEDKFLDWAEQYAGLFAEIAANDLELDERIRMGKITDEDLVFIADMMREYDLGVEDHTPGPELDA